MQHNYCCKLKDQTNFATSVYIFCQFLLLLGGHFSAAWHELNKSEDQEDEGEGQKAGGAQYARSNQCERGKETWTDQEEEEGAYHLPQDNSKQDLLNDQRPDQGMWGILLQD